MMKALVLEKYMHLGYKEVNKPEPGDNEVLVKIQAVGICGSDVHGMDGSTGRRILPIIIGHEASGIIEQTGAAVTQWKKGDRVTFDSLFTNRMIGLPGRACIISAEGKLNVKSILSAEAPLAEGAEWFNRLYNKEKGLMKVILKP